MDRDSLDSLYHLDRIHLDALRVLEEVGVKCESDAVRAVFEDTGLAAFDETSGHVHILPELVNQALAILPGRDRFWVPENSFGVGGSAPFVYDDAKGELVTPTIDHLVHIARIADQSDQVQFMCRGVLIRDREAEVMEALSTHCRKTLYVPALTPGGLEKACEIHNQRGKIVACFSLVNSPLTLMPAMVDPFLAAVERGLPIYLSSMPMAGLSAPYSLSGLLALTHAEALFGLTLVQLLRPGTLCVHAGLPSIANIRTNYSVDLGLVSHNLANLLLARICKRLDIPSIQSGCATSELAPGPRAEQDGVQGYGLFKRYGFHQMRHAFGFLKELVSFSIAKLERHIALCEQTGPDQAPDFEVEPYDPEGVEAIIRNRSTPNYMRDPHTLKHTGRAFDDAFSREES